MHHTIWTSLCAQHKVHVKRTDSTSQTAQRKANGSQGASPYQSGLTAVLLIATHKAAAFQDAAQLLLRAARASLQLGQTGVTRGVLLIQPFVERARLLCALRRREGRQFGPHAMPEVSDGLAFVPF